MSYPARGSFYWDQPLKDYIDTEARQGVPGVPGGVEIIRPEALAPWYASIAQAKTKVARAAFIGSSTTAGTGVTPITDRWTDQFIARVQKAYPNGATETPVMQFSAAVSAPPTTPGVQGFNGALAGTNSANYCGSVTRSSIGTLNPILVVHMIGSNDALESNPSLYVPPATYRQNVETAISLMAATRVHLLVHSYRRREASVSAEKWAEYGDALRQIAYTRSNVAFLDLSRPFDAVRGASDPLGLIGADGVHPSTGGHAYIAGMIGQALGFS